MCEKFLKRIGYKFLILLFLFPIQSLADGTCEVTLPKECHKIVDSEFSTGGGDKLIWVIEIGCEGQNGTYKKYLATRVAPTAILGSLIGRWNVPSEITFKFSDVPETTMSCD